MKMKEYKTTLLFTDKTKLDYNFTTPIVLKKLQESGKIDRQGNNYFMHNKIKVIVKKA